MSGTTLVGVRVHSWQWFKLCQWAKLKKTPLGRALTEAIQEYLAMQNIPQENLDDWLKTYHQDTPDEMD